MTERQRILFLCTGNATRSVLGAAALARLRPDLTVASAGTLVIEGLPMSFRTRAGFAAIDLPAPDHRSRQAMAAMIDGHDLIVAMAPEHVRWIRREHHAASSRTATVKRLCRDLSPDDLPLAERIIEMDLAAVVTEDWEEVVDPGGGDVDRFVECAIELDALITQLAVIL